MILRNMQHFILVQSSTVIVSPFPFRRKDYVAAPGLLLTRAFLCTSARS